MIYFLDHHADHRHTKENEWQKKIFEQKKKLTISYFVFPGYDNNNPSLEKKIICCLNDEKQKQKSKSL